VEIFDIFGAAFPLPVPIEVNCTAKRTHVPVGSAKFDMNRCNESPLRSEILIFGLWVNLIPAVCRLAASGR